MSNSIYNSKAPASAALTMNNSLTAVFIETLVVAGSSIASNQWEKEYIVWLSEHDQSLLGIGIVGFDIDEIAWRVDDFTQQQAFVVSVIEHVRRKHRWAVLGYQPREDWLFSALDKFEELVQGYTREMIGKPKEWDWMTCTGDSDRPALDKWCPKHGVLEHGEGCVICRAGR